MVDKLAVFADQKSPSRLRAGIFQAKYGKSGKRVSAFFIGVRCPAISVFCISA